MLQLQLQQGRASLQAAADLGSHLAGVASTSATVQPHYATAQDRHVFRNTAKPGYVPDGPQPGAFSQPAPAPVERQQQAEVTLAPPPAQDDTRTNLADIEREQDEDEPRYWWQKISFLASVDKRGFYFSIFAILILVASFLVLGVTLVRGNSSEEYVEEQTPPPQPAMPINPGSPTRAPTPPAPTTSASPSFAPSVSLAPSAAPSAAPTWDLVEAKEFLIKLLPERTVEIIQNDPLSPQAKALEFVAIDKVKHGGSPKWQMLQRFALVALYHSTDGDQWQNNKGWLDHDKSECEWYSSQQDLACYPDPGSASGTDRLTYKRLKLPRNNLQGSLPEELFSFLPNLEQVDLSLNRLTGRLPTQIGAVTKLMEFGAGSNELTGQLPSQLGLLSNYLTKIALRRNQISGSLPTQVGLLFKLESLDMANSELQSTIPTELGRCQALEYISFSNNQLSGPIPSELGQLAQLETLSLPLNNLQASIPPELGLLPNLESLLLYSNQLTGTLVWLGNVSSSRLKEIDTTNNNLSGEIPNELCPKIEFDCNDDSLCGCDCPCAAG